jgi:hypothetical protein
MMIGRTKSRVSALLIFFLVNIIQGGLAFSMLLRLPKSEAGRSFLSGYSMIRLLMLASCVLAIVIFILLFILLLVRYGKKSVENLIGRIENWCTRYDLLLAFLLFACLLLFLVDLFVIIYMQPDIFPLSRIYMYIYERIQPHLVWFTAFCGETFILFWLLFWKSRPRFLPPGSRGARLAAFLCVLTASIIMGFLWFLYARHIGDYLQFIRITLPLLILSILTLLAGVGLSTIDARGGRRLAQDE